MKSPNPTIDTKNQNTSITPAYHFILHLDNGYWQWNPLEHRVKNTNSLLEQVLKKHIFRLPRRNIKYMK